MGFVVSLVDFMPPPRYDGHPWTHALIGEAAVPSGPFPQIDDITLPSPDADPSQPAPRSVTTSNGSLASGWYTITFEDAAGGLSEISDPVRSSVATGLLPPGPDAVRNASPLLRSKFPLPPSDPFQVADLRNTVYQSIALVQAITWRLIDPTLGCAAAEGYTCEAVPDALVPTAVQAIARMAERITVTTEPEFAEQLATGKILRGFSAGPYSENYFAPGEFARKGAQQGRPPMDADDALDVALWALATEDARDYFVGRATGIMPPVGVAVSFDYRRMSSGYSAGSLGGRRSGVGPDGF